MAWQYHMERVLQLAPHRSTSKGSMQPWRAKAQVLSQLKHNPLLTQEWSPCKHQVLNKTDLLHPEELSQTTDWLLKNTGAASILHTSAIANEGVESVRDWAVDNLPLGPTLYPKVRITR